MYTLSKIACHLLRSPLDPRRLAGKLARGNSPFRGLGGILAAGLLVLSASSVFAQTYPASATTIVSPPYSVYLGDYFSLESDKLKVNLRFNDFNEPSWEVRLRFSLESSDIKIQTRPDFIPSLPITLTPGAPLILSSGELAEYFNFNNLTFSGITAGELTQNGRLPENLYSFCFEVLDFRSGKSLSLPGCSNAWVVLKEPPYIITPLAGAVIPPTNPQNIPFNWQMANIASPGDAFSTEYQLAVYEITDRQVEPINAINNGKALKIFTSDWIPQTSFLYGLNASILDVGKRYVFQVQAKDTDGRDLFKNSGFSQISWFDYGYPQDGLVTLKEPLNNAAASLRDFPKFVWGAPNNLLPGQRFHYEFTLVEILQGQDENQAIETNVAVATYATPDISSTFDIVHVLDNKLVSLKEYAWQVNAFSGEQLVAKSPVYTLSGPPVLDKFSASGQEILVKSTENTDLTNLNGIALVKISDVPDAPLLEIPFQGLNIRKTSTRYVLDAGEILFDLNVPPIELNPDIKENQTAFFYPDKIRINKDQFNLHGNIKWPLPHAVTTGEAAFVVSESNWFNFFGYKLNGLAVLTRDNTFNLLDPYEFTLQLATTSDFFLVNGKFKLRLNGKLLLPEKIHGEKSTRVEFPYELKDQLYYFTLRNLDLSNNIYVIPNATITLVPRTVTLDLSEKESPRKFLNNKLWKGLYFDEFDLLYPQKTDGTNQFTVNPVIVQNFELSINSDIKAWTTGVGLTCSLTTPFLTTDAAKFNTFPSKLKEMTLNLVDGVISNSYIKGSVKIPVVDITRDFDYTIPLADNGFQAGYLDQSLEESNFIFNPYGGENKVELTIKRAVFADKERLDMTVDISIPYINALMTGVNDFRVYGDYFIGFGKRNGAAHLDNHVLGEYDGFSMFIDQIAASFTNGNYAFSYSATMPMGEEVSGNDGPPRINIHSIEKGGELLTSAPVQAGITSDLPPPQDDSAFGSLLKFDSAFIKIESAIVDLQGYLKITKDDPKWGTSFQGGIYGNIKIPGSIETGANIVLGDRDNLKYWYFDAWFVDHQGMGIPVFNMFNIVGFEGKVYRHMELDKTTPTTDHRPSLKINPDVQFGAGLYMQLIDKTGGKQFMTDIGAEVLVNNQGFVVAMEGDISALNVNGRNTAVAGQVRQQALKKAAEEAAKKAIQSIGEISVDIPIGGGAVLGVKASGTGGGLSYTNSDLSVAFEGQVGSVPSAAVSFKSGSKEISVSGNANANASLLLKDGSNELGIDIEGRNGGKLNFIYDALHIQTAFNKLEGSGSVLFQYDDKIIDVAANKRDGNGHLGIQYGEKKRMYLELDRAGKGAFEFQYDDNLVAIKGDKETGSGSLKVQVGEHLVAVEANKQEGSGSLLVQSGQKLLSIAGNKNGSGSLTLTDGEKLFDVAADKNAGTGHLELKYADDKRMYIAGDRAGRGELEFQYGQKFFRIAADKTIGMGELKLRDGDDKYFNVYVNKSENRGNLGFRYGQDSISALIDSDTSALAFVIRNKVMAIGLHRAGKGGLTLQDGDKLFAITADKTQGSGSLRLEDGPGKRIFVSANKTLGTGQLELAFNNNRIKAGISPNEGSLAFDINNTQFNISASRDGSGSLGFRHADKSIAVQIANGSGSFELSDGTRLLSLDMNKTLHFKDGSRDIRLLFGAAGGNIQDGNNSVPISRDDSGNGSYRTTVNGVEITFTLASSGNSLKFSRSGTAFEIGLDAQGYGKIALTINGATYTAIQNNANTVTISDGSRSLSVSGDKTLVFREGNSKSVSISPTGLTLVYDGHTLGFGNNKYISYASAERSFDLGADGLSISEGSRSLSLTADKQLILRDGDNRSISISASQLTLRNDGMEISLGSDKSLRYSDPDRSFSLSTQGLEIVQGDKSMAILNSESGIALELKDGARRLFFSRNEVVLSDGSNSFTLGGEQYMAINFQGKNISVGDGFISYEEGSRRIAFGGEYFVELRDGDRLISISKEKVFTLADGNKSVSIGADKSFRISDGTRTISIGGESALSYQDAENTVEVKAANGVYGFSFERPEIKLMAETQQFRKSKLTVETSSVSLSLASDASKNLEAIYTKGDRIITLTHGVKGTKLEDSESPVPQISKDDLPEVGTQAPDITGPQYIGKVTDNAMGFILGNIKLYFNSAETHLIANASVLARGPICLSGALAIESRGSYWKIDIGTEQERIRIFPSCSGFGGGGWLGIDPSTISVGVFGGFRAGGEVGIDFGVGSASIRALVEAEIGVRARATLQPDFLINEAGVWVRLYAGISVSYNVLGDSGSVNIAEAELKGTLTFYFNDGTRMVGTLDGYIKVIGIGADFSMGFDKQL